MIQFNSDRFGKLVRLSLVNDRKYYIKSFLQVFVIFLMMPKKFGIPALCVCIIMAYSRLHVGVHYPTDVIVGTIIGIGFAVMYTVICKKKFAPAAESEEPRKESI